MTGNFYFYFKCSFDYKQSLTCTNLISNDSNLQFSQLNYISRILLLRRIAVTICAEEN